MVNLVFKRGLPRLGILLIYPGADCQKMDTTSEYFPLRARYSTFPEVPMVPLTPVLVINWAVLEVGMYKNIDICYRRIKISKKMTKYRYRYTQ